MAAPDAVEALADKLGLPADSAQLAVALTHSSYLAEHGGVCNERLEFLGDAVLDLAVTDLIVREHPELDQGTGSFTRAMVVNEASLADVARTLNIGEALRVGRGTRQQGVNDSDGIMADAFEAVLAALFLERGYSAAHDFVRRHLGARIGQAATHLDDHDPKTTLKDELAAHGRAHPHYDITETGPPNDRRYRATVVVDGTVLAHATARSKKQAEREAAHAALEVLRA